MALNKVEQNELFQILDARFKQNMHRHKNIHWNEIVQTISTDTNIISAIHAMEITGGEPDLICNKSKSIFMYCDCSAESPKGRRSLCYDRAALHARKANKPENSAEDMSLSMGINILSEEQYRMLQQFGEFDTKTSSWIKTPDTIRKLGGALFCDRRYNTVFVYHNGAESYYAARGFRGFINI